MSGIVEKDFDEWNNIKKKLEKQAGELSNYPKAGEVWVVNLGKNIGYEQNGASNNFSRPVLVIRKFNNQMFWCVPLSSKQKKIDFYYNFTDASGQKVSAILSQMKLLSIKRFNRKLYDLDQNLFQEIRIKLKNYV